MSRKTIFIYSMDNSARLQMAEGFLREYSDVDRWTVRAGGKKRNLLHPLAVEVMDEVNIDIRNQTVNLVDTSLLNYADYIVDLTGDIRSDFRHLAANIRIESWSFEEPERAEGTEEEKLLVFRRVRDAIRNRVQEFLEVEG